MKQKHIEAKKTEAIEKTDICDLIREEHKPLKALIKILKDVDKGLETRRAAYAEFAPMLVAHAKPEEETLYVYVKHDDDLKNEAYEGEEEHALADQKIAEIDNTDNDDVWSAKVNVLAELVEHHIKEEEEELLPAFKKSTADVERTNLGDLYLKLKKRFVAERSKNAEKKKPKQVESTLQH